MKVYPFAALRPAAGFADKVAAPPYDVLSTEEAREMAADNPYSFLHVDKSEIDLPEDTDIHSPSVYEKAGDNLKKMAADGTLIKDGKPCFYLYRLTMNDRAQTGLAACVAVADYEADIIKKHEFTRPDKEKDRVDHILACSAHTGPIFMAYRGEGGTGGAAVRELIGGWCAVRPPAYSFTCEDGVRHELWVVDDDATAEAISEAFGAVPCVYIADGHHRSAAAVRASKERAGSGRVTSSCDTGEGQPQRACGLDGTQSSITEAEKFLAVIFPHDELEILDYNRLVKDLNGRAVDEFLKEIAGDFDAEISAEPVKPTATYEYGFYAEGKWYRLTYKHQPPGDEVDALAVSVLQDKILSPVLNISDPRSDKRIDFVGGARGTDGLVKRVDSGETAAAFTLSPTKMEELLNVADAEKIMPPKSTWFEPKLRSGLLIHEFI